MTWTDICHRCGAKVFNGIPEGRETIEYIEEMKVKGYILGYNNQLTGSVSGKLQFKKRKPICTNCTKEIHEKEEKKKLKKQIRKIIPKIKKVYVCPVYITGFGECDFKCDKKQYMINHIKSHGSTDLSRFVGD